MTIEPRQRVLLWVLGGLLLVFGWNRLGDISFGRGASLQPASAPGAERSRSLSTEVVGVDLSLLDPPAGEFEVGRDPFRYGVIVQPPPKPPPVRRPVPVREPTPEVEPEDQGPVPPSVDGFKYLGSFGRDGNKIAVLINGEDIYNVREGESFEDSFSVREIGYESVAIGFVDFPDVPPKRLPVGG